MPSIQSSFFKQLVKRYISKTLRTDVPIEKQRKALERLEKVALPSPFTKILPLDIQGCKAEWIKHKTARHGHAILYLHGGGFTTGSPRTHRLLAERLSFTCRASVLLLDYRLAPEHPFPSGLNDSVNAYQWLLQQGIMPQNLAIAGDSAGGGLAISTLLKLKEAYSPLPAAAVLFSPWVDLTMSGESITSNINSELMLSVPWMELMAKHYIGEDKSNPLASPLFADLSALPPTMIQVDDSEVLLDDAIRLNEKLNEVGVTSELNIWRGQWHDWQTFVKFVPEANQAVDQAGNFILRFWKEDI